MHKYLFFIKLLLLLVLAGGCRKFLDEKSDKKLVIPQTLEDLQALMDLQGTLNTGGPVSGEISADDFYLTTESYQSLSDDFYRNMYTWQSVNIYYASYNDWYYTFSPVYYSNIVLDRLTKIERNAVNAEEWDNIKGQALAFRAYRFLAGITLWGNAYDAGTAQTDLGIPIRLGIDFNEPSVRGTVQQAYARIIADLKEAVQLLPVRPLGVSRPGKSMAYSVLARTFIFMRMYEQAGLYADSALQINSTLLDYNTLSSGQLFPLVQNNPEVIFQQSANIWNDPLKPAFARVDSVLFRMFHVQDLRRDLFFRANTDGTFRFEGNYTGSRASMFTGIANDEIYLMRAEAYARTEREMLAMEDLNTLLEKRWKASEPFVPLVAANANEALQIILRERRKELIFRGLRWPDIKRLNKEGANIVLRRQIDGQTYTLPPDAVHYALPIPEEVLELSGMLPNPSN